MNLNRSESFIGPLPEESYLEVKADYNLFPQDRLAEDLARTRYGQKIAKILLSASETEVEKYKVDQMTGFLRRDAFIEETDKKQIELAKRWTKRSNDPNSALFIMVDIVGLHDINNSGGQIAGDKAIQAMADFIKHITRVGGPDIAGRLGGDEFAIFIPYSSDVIAHEQMVGIIQQRIETVRQAYDLSPDEAPPAFRYRYTTSDGDIHPIDTAAELLVLADPKRKGFSPEYSYPRPQTKSAV